MNNGPIEMNLYFDLNDWLKLPHIVCVVYTWKYFAHSWLKEKTDK